MGMVLNTEYEQEICWGLGLGTIGISVDIGICDR